MDNVRSNDGEGGRSGGLGGWKTRDLVVAAALAVPLGLVYAAWLTAWTAARVVPEVSHVLGGLYVIAGVLAAYVIRRPGSAFLAEVIAALVETPFSPFGLITLWLGLLQAVGIEAVFLATRYRRFDLVTLMVAGAVGALMVLFGRFYTAFGYASLTIDVQIIRFVATVVGGALFGGLGAKLIGDALARTGVLNNFAIARDRVREV
jgi:energy-coupling factor transport system substrate-specific component